jgi:DNA-binding MarR family transcriptional regulator
MNITAEAAELARDLRVLVGRLRRRIKEAADTLELTPSQWTVVNRLDRDGPATASALAAAERVRPQSIAATIAALDERGWLVRTPDPNDGRKQLLSLSDTALADVSGVRQVRDEWLSRALQDNFTAPERATIAEALTLLGRLT